MEPQIIQYYRVKNQPKSAKIKSWKNQGIISEDWNKTYERYIKTLYCEKCNCLLVRGGVRCRETACIHHDHSITNSDNIRNILCMSCNSKLQ